MAVWLFQACRKCSLNKIPIFLASWFEGQICLDRFSDLAHSPISKFLILVREFINHVNEKSNPINSFTDGGFQLGSLNLIGNVCTVIFICAFDKKCVLFLWKEEDEHGSYSNLITKYFLAEGVHKGNYVLEASMSEDPWDLVTRPIDFFFLSADWTLWLLTDWFFSIMLGCRGISSAVQPTISCYGNKWRSQTNRKQWRVKNSVALREPQHGCE